MNCDSTFETVEDHLGDLWVRPTTTTAHAQCVVDFFHPRTVERLGDDGVVTAFNRSGVVWAPPGRRLGIQLRVPDDFDAEVRSALDAAPFPVSKTDHRGASAPDGEMVSLLHYAIRATDVADEAFDATLAAVADALRV
jgi:hypothetical protein